MPSARTLEAGKAVIKLSLKDEVSQGLTRVGKKMQTLGGVAAAAGGSIVAAFTAATSTFVSMGDQLNDMSTRTGFAIESLSKLSYAASQSGTSLESVERAAKGMAKVIYGASTGVEAAAKTLEALGISAKELEGLSPDEQFRKLAGAIANVQDPTKRAALAMKAFGKSGADLLPMLAEGEAGLEAMFAEAERLGIVMSEDDAKAAAELDDAFNKLTSQVKGLAVQVGSAIAGPLGDFGNALSEALVSAVSFAKENPKLVAAIAVIGTEATIAGVALAGVGTALTFIAAHPVVATIVGITAAVIALNEALKGFSEWLADTPDAKRLANDLKEARDVLKEMEAAAKKLEEQKNRANPQPFTNDEGQTVGGTNGKFSNGVGWGNNTDPNKDLIDLNGPQYKGQANSYTTQSGSATAINSWGGKSGYGVEIGSMSGAGGFGNSMLGPMLEQSFAKGQSGQAGAATLTAAAALAWDAVKKQAGNLNAELGITDKFGKAKDAFAEFKKKYGKGGPESDTGMSIATLDARNASLQFGRQSRSEELLTAIKDNTKKAADAKGGIPVV